MLYSGRALYNKKKIIYRGYTHTAAEVDAEHPRLKIALERSYADFSAAHKWLAENSNNLIESSPAKQYYDEVLGLDKGSIKNIATFYA